jgi:hypothetical protein
MTNIVIVLIPLAIVCIGLIVFTIYDFMRDKIVAWYWKVIHDIEDSVTSSVKYKIDSDMRSLANEISKKTNDPSLVERFQKLAGITPTYKSDRNSLEINKTYEQPIINKYNA